MMSFSILLFFAKRGCVHSVGEVAVCCHFILKWVVGEEIDGDPEDGHNDA